MSKALTAGLIGLALAGPVHADCPSIPDAQIYKGTQAHRIDNALVYRAPELRVDADGAPDAYRLDGKGLSFSCDGMVAVKDGKRVTPQTDPGTWETECLSAFNEAKASGDYSHLAIFGFLSENGAPVVQGEGDPWPGEAFVSTTSVQIPGIEPKSQRAYVDANEIPYIVLPSSFVSRNKVADGALAVVYDPASDRLAFAVYGDAGGALDEGSVRLHNDLGHDPILIKNEVRRAKRTLETPLWVLVFPNQAATPQSDAASWRADITIKGALAFAAWGGLERLKACAG